MVEKGVNPTIGDYILQPSYVRWHQSDHLCSSLTLACFPSARYRGDEQTWKRRLADLSPVTKSFPPSEFEAGFRPSSLPRPADFEI